MTEAEWLACADPERMLRWLTDKRVSERQLRWFGVACCRRIMPLFNDERSLKAVEAAEAYLAGTGTEEEMSTACDDAEHPYQDANLRAGDSDTLDAEQDQIAEDAAIAAHMVSWPGLRVGFAVEVAIGAAQATAGRTIPNEESKVQATLGRDIFGNPFRPVAFAPEWRTDTAFSLARTMYDSRDFGAMPILADALQDAGCDNEDILAHCRDANQVHVRGCWVVDLVLGKS